MSDTEEKVVSPDPHIKNEDYDQAVRTIKQAQATRGTDGEPEFAGILTSFIYVLLRDHLPAGQVEQAVREVTDGNMVVFTDSFLAQYADSLSTTLKDVRVNALANALEKAFIGKEPEVDIKTKLKTPQAHFGDDGEDLQNLQQRVDDAIDNMTEEDQTEWKEHKDDVLEEVPRNDEIGLLPNAEAANIEKDTAEILNEADEAKDASRETQKYSDEISDSLAALDNLKELLPTDTIRQVADILKQEVKAELVVDKPVEEIVTREDVLKRQAAIMEEHKATNPEATRMAEKYIQEQLAGEVEDKTESPTVSRGKLSDVSNGKAFPEALTGVFDDGTQADIEKAEAIAKQMEAVRNNAKSGAFKRVE